jgi:KDO2-lipid IV(A) lauroyltransferase
LQNRPKKIRLKHHLEFVIIRIFQGALSVLPLKLVEWIGPWVGSLIWVIFPYRLEVVYTNLTFAFPDKTRAEKLSLAHRIYRHYGYIFMTYLVMHRPSMRRRIENLSVTGTDCIGKALAEGKGAVLAGIHFGPWEAYGAWMNLNGYPVSAIYRTQKNPLTDRFFIQHRARFGPNLRHIAKHSFSRFVKELKANRLLLVGVDQKGGKRGTRVLFFNQMTSIAKGAAFLHLRTGAPILWGAPVVRAGKMSLEMGRLQVPSVKGVSQENIHTVTAAIMVHFEAIIRNAPEQWFWFHKLWPKAYPKKMRRSIDEIVSSLKTVDFDT